MRKHNQLSESKKVKIVTGHILNKHEQGKYFTLRAKNPKENLPLVRAAMLPEYYSVFLDQTIKERNWHEVILSGKKRRSVKDLDSVRLYSSDVEAEYFWAKYVIAINVESLDNFIKYAVDYAMYLIQGEYEECSKILNTIEKDYGFSIWLIKNKIAFLQMTQGLEAQKKYIQSIKNSLRDGGLIKFVLHWISVRNEPQTSVGRFTSQIENIISSMNPEKQRGFHEFSKYHLLGEVPMELEDVGQILRLSYSTSLIDYYEAFILLMQSFSNDTNGKYDVRLRNLFRSSGTFRSDPRFQMLNAIAEKSISPQLTSQGLDSYELFLKGQHENAYSSASKVLEEFPNSVLAILAMAYSKAMIEEASLGNGLSVKNDEAFDNEKSLSDNVIDGISKIYRFGIEGATEEYNRLSKIALNFACFSWVASIEIAIGQERHFLGKMDELSGRLIHRDSCFNPILIDKIANEDLAKRYSAQCDLTYNGSQALAFHKRIAFNQVSELSSDLSHIQQKLALAEIYFNKGEFESSIENSEHLKNTLGNYFSRRGFGIQAFSYLNRGNLNMVCKTVADCYIHNKSYYPFLPLFELSEAIKPGSENWKQVNSTIDLSIIFDACVKHIDKSFETARRFAYEDYLEKRGIDRPSELMQFLQEENTSKINYYLRFICIESTMDMSGAFEGGSSEVLAERLHVCRLLADLDPKNEDLYKSEISDLVRRQVILSRRQEVDQSRIYVDIESVKDLAQSELTEIFARYQAYLKYGVNTSINADKNFDKLAHESNSKSLNTQINVPHDEVLSLLSFMIGTISRWYLSSEVGLDRFISTRIRHGELERTMRIPLQNHNLITKKQIKTGPYLPNRYWLDKFEDHPDYYELDKAFNKFSEDYDQLIAKIANDWLQIVKSNKPNGLFDFTIFESDYQWIYDSTDEHTSFKTFVDNVIRLLEQKLIFTLVGIREKLNKVARIEAKTLLNNLQEATFGNHSPYTELQTAINQSRTDLQSQFDKIIEWFVPSSTGNSTPYQIEDAIWVAEASIKEENPMFIINVEAEESELSIHGQLPIFVDIFINIFENVVKRSGLDCPSAKVEIVTDSISDELTIISCKVTNALGKDIDQVALDSELRRKKTILDSGDYIQYLATDKNSGLYKIYKSVKDFHILGLDVLPTIDFGLKENQFFVLISVPFKIFKLEEVEQI